MKSISIGKLLITLVALFTSFGSYAFDWNETHIFNPLWPPHAKFHNAQTMLLGTMLGLVALWLLWLQKGSRIDNLRLTVVVASLYWLGQVGALFFPGTALVDPEFAYRGQAPAQLIVCGVVFVLLSVAYLLETRGLNNSQNAKLK